MAQQLVGGGRGRLAQPPPPPGYRHVSLEEYVHAMISRDPWIPHPLNAREIDALRQSRIEDGPEHRAEVVKAYVAYQLKYWRTFRLNDLPIEILSNILRFVVWSAPSPQIGIRWRLQLTWVSKHLRHAAVSDSTLWNAIWFRDEPPFERSLAFVDRSGVSPLDLRINDMPERAYTDEEICALLKALTPHLHHIRMLIILLHNWDPILSTRIPWPGHNFNPTGTVFMPRNHQVTLYPLFGGTLVPTLKSFTMNGVHIDWTNTPSLANLSTLDIRRIPLHLCPPLSRFREILDSSPRLTKLSLDGAGPSGRFSSSVPINLPQLHTLVLANFAAQFTTSIVSHFTAPHVRDLTIMNFKGDNYDPFYSFMTGRFPEIKLLTLYTTNCPPPMLPVMIKWLDSMPLLTYARMAALEYDILQAFIFDPDTMKLHPALGHDVRIKFQIFENFVFDDATAPLPEVLADENRLPRVVCPRLNILEVQNIMPNIFTEFVGARKMCGVPVRKTYMSKGMVTEFNDHQMSYVRAHVPELMIVDIGAKTQEEEELLNG
ncbi:hypothetical protein BT96DRAFT_920800 [Gymnopus androsaceus JB14]|uniref:F-box domain-containing protein n=1 Tax=Gymnopus androsaceus JB14 TaxID=1447944 RepID=A0A6A4HN20_9AGAR|nr:hypothetical protein BT96DRAFT_920800 [Gymnopus androsaceus JB14]